MQYQNDMSTPSVPSLVVNWWPLAEGGAPKNACFWGGGAPHTSTPRLPSTSGSLPPRVVFVHTSSRPLLPREKIQELWNCYRILKTKVHGLVEASFGRSRGSCYVERGVHECFKNVLLHADNPF